MAAVVALPANAQSGSPAPTPAAPVVRVPSPYSVAPAPPHPALLPAEPPSLADASGGPSAADLVEGYVAPRLSALSHAAQALQNGILRTCGAGTEDAEYAVEQALDGAVVAAAGAAAVQTIRPEAVDTAVEVLVPVFDTEGSRARFDAISRGSLPAPRSLEALAQEPPGLAGLSAVELILRRIAVVSTKDRCALALAAAANVRVAAMRREAAFRTGSIAPAWDPAAPADPLAGRQRLRDLLEALLLAFDRMNRELSLFAETPRSNRALPFLSAPRMQRYLAAEAEALAQHVRLIRTYPLPDTAADAVASDVEAGLVKLRDTLSRPGEAGRARRATALAAFEAAQAAAVTRLPQAFGFEPSELRRPLAAYETRTPTD